MANYNAEKHQILLAENPEARFTAHYALSAKQRDAKSVNDSASFRSGSSNGEWVHLYLIC